MAQVFSGSVVRWECVEITSLKMVSRPNKHVYIRTY